MSENDFDIIIVGAGAAGLAAALELVQKGKKVAIFEAHNRIGGRIHTIQPAGFDLPVEAGAEFVHGDLPVTIKLLKHYKIPYHAVGGEMWRTKDGTLTPGSWQVSGFDKLFELLPTVKTDISVQQFLDDNFREAEYRELYASIQHFVEGFDSGDISSASLFKFRDEWTEMEERQYRVEGGYVRLMDALCNDFKKQGGTVFLSSPISTINWKKNEVKVSSDNRSYSASKILITVPLGILQAEQGAKGYINFQPPVSEKIEAAKKLGYGAIMKGVFRFSDSFWNRFGFVKNNVGFIFSDTLVPVLWTQMPDPQPVLTTWVGGPTAWEWQFVEQEEMLKIIYSSLAITFGISEEELRNEVLASHISNWTNEPYIMGSYSFTTVGDGKAIDVLKGPVEDTIYFAGEALFVGEASGTVEAALHTGLDAVQQIFN